MQRTRARLPRPLSLAAGAGAAMPQLRLRLPRPSAERSLRVAAAAAGAAALGGMTVISYRIATAAAADPKLLVPSGHHSFPRWLRGPLAGHGSPIGIHEFVLLLVAMTGLYVVAVVCAKGIPLWLGGGVIVLLHAIFALAPPLLSEDVFNYVAYARMGTIYGINPYLHGPAAIALDPGYWFWGHLWNHTPTAYGPLFTLLTYALPVKLAPALWSMKGIVAAAGLGCVALVWACARRLGVDPMRAALFVALNPLWLVYTIGGAHNDALMALPLLAGVYWLLTRRPELGGGAIVVAASIKLSAGLVLPFAILGVRPRWRVAAGAAVAAALIGAVTVAAFGTNLRGTFDFLRLQEHLNWVVLSVPGYIGHYLGVGGMTAHRRHVLEGVFALGCGYLLFRAWRGRNWLASAGWASLLLLLTTGWLLPWYLVWVLPLAPLVRRSWLPIGAVGLTLVLTAMQITHYVVTDHHHRHRHHHVHLRGGTSLAARPARAVFPAPVRRE